MPQSAQRPITPTADLIDDSVDIDGVDYRPLRIGFQLSRKGRWTGRLKLNQEKSVEVALTILALANQFGASLTNEQRRSVAEIATHNVHRNRKRAVLARYDDGKITLEETKRLEKQVTVRNLAEIDALAAG